MNAASSSSSKRGRSTTRSSRGSRAISMSNSRSVSRNQRNGYYRTWATPSRALYFDPFPTKMQARMRYAESITLDASGGLATSYLFRANSIFDPNFTGTGHQPYGHDTYQSIYNHYKVDRATITVTLNSSAVNTQYGVALTDDSSVAVDQDAIKEQKNSRFTCIAGAPSSPQSVTLTYNDKVTFPFSSATDTGALFGTNPTEQAFFQVWQAPNVSAGDPGVIAVQITITYWVSMWELKFLGTS